MGTSAVPGDGNCHSGAAMLSDAEGVAILGRPGGRPLPPALKYRGSGRVAGRRGGDLRVGGGAALGGLRRFGGLLARAEAHVKQRLDVEHDVWAAVHVPIGRGDGALLRGDRATAGRQWRAAADTAAELGSGFSVAAVLAECARTAHGEGRLADAAVSSPSPASWAPGGAGTDRR